MLSYMATAVEVHESCDRPGTGAFGCQAAGCVVLGGHLSPCQRAGSPWRTHRAAEGMLDTWLLPHASLAESMASSSRGMSELVWVSARSRALVCPE